MVKFRKCRSSVDLRALLRSWWQLQAVSGGQQGTTLLETTIGMVFVVPLSFLVIFTASLIHDIAVVSPVPEAIVAASQVVALRWEPSGKATSITLSHDNLERTLTEFVTAGISTVSTQSLRLKRIAARACYWECRVDEMTGRIGNPLSTFCKDGGDEAIAQGLSFGDALMARQQNARGIKISSGEGEPQFLDRVVLWGLAVGGEFSGIPALADTKIITSGVVELPRREVSL